MFSVQGKPEYGLIVLDVPVAFFLNIINYNGSNKVIGVSVQTWYHCEEEEEEEQTGHCGLFSARRQLLRPPAPSSPVSSAPALAVGSGSD